MNEYSYVRCALFVSNPSSIDSSQLAKELVPSFNVLNETAVDYEGIRSRYLKSDRVAEGCNTRFYSYVWALL